MSDYNPGEKLLFIVLDTIKKHSQSVDSDEVQKIFDISKRHACRLLHRLNEMQGFFPGLMVRKLKLGGPGNTQYEIVIKD